MILYLEIECKLYEGYSLKDKRSVLKQNIHKLKKNFNVAIAELDYMDLWQRTKLGIVTITNSRIHAEQMAQQILDAIDSVPEWERTITNVDEI